MRETKLLLDGWSFAALPLDSSPEAARAAAFTPVELPHDFLIGDTQALYRDCDGWYRRILPKARDGERTMIRFDGVYMDTTLYLNGSPVFQWKYGYTPFVCELTEWLGPEENELLVHARHRAPNSRWYSGAGIYRDVWLIRCGESCFAPDGIYATPIKEGDRWTLRVTAETLCKEGCRIRHLLLDRNGREVCRSEGGAEQAFEAPGVREWGALHPELYTLRSSLIRDGQEEDRLQTAVGFRQAAFDPNRGFLLNGRQLKLHGVCMHHDLGALGARFNRAAALRQLTMLQRMGVNALRTSHNPPAEALLDMCDGMGMLVVDEGFDMWELPKNPFDYARFFPEWYARDVRAWVRRDRNHPCVIAWSVGNEIYDTEAGPRGKQVVADLAAAVRKHDPLGSAPVTFASNHMAGENTQRCAGLLGAVGYNYAERLYHDHHRRYPSFCIWGSEVASVVQSRGVYHFPLSEPILTDDDLQCSSLGNSGTSWGARNLEACLCDDRDATFSAGLFLWSGFDYIGEPTPYRTKNSYFGMIDTAGFEKDAFHVVRSMWTDWRAEPFVHLYPHWDWNEGQLIDVRAATNAPRVRLYLNGDCLGEQRLEQASGRKIQGDWRIPFRPGVLRAEALDEEGRVLCAMERASFGDAARLELVCDRESLAADGEDMAFVTVSALDARGKPVENANNRVRIRVGGAARLVGMDNGDSTDMEPYQTDSRRLFSGKLLAMLMATGEAGEVLVTASSPSLPDAALRLRAVPAAGREGIPCFFRVPAGPDSRELPVRKIEIHCPGGTKLTPERPQLTAEARLLPAGATWPDLLWRVTASSGADSPVASLDAQGATARVTARGNGRFYLRCMAFNGREHPTLISSIECEAEGFGPAQGNPYAVRQAGSYDLRAGDLSSGNERGVSVPPGGRGMFGFVNLDFGLAGADSLTVSVLNPDRGSHVIHVWDGEPGRGGMKLMDAVCQRPTVWPDYHQETWALPRVLRGLRTVCFETGDHMHVRDVVFRKAEGRE